MDILFDEEGGIVTESAIYVALCKQIEILFGDYGMAAAKLSLSVKVYLLVSLLKSTISRNYLSKLFFKYI